MKWCVTNSKLIIQITNCCSSVHYKIWVHSSYPGLQGSYSDTKVNGVTQGKQRNFFVPFDSRSIMHIARNPAFHSRTKYIGVHYHFVQEVVEEGSVYTQKIQTNNNLAGVMKKPINVDKFIWCWSPYALFETQQKWTR